MGYAVGMQIETTPVIRFRKPQRNWVDLIESIKEEGLPMDIPIQCRQNFRWTAAARGYTVVSRKIEKDKSLVRVWLFKSHRGQKIAV